MIPKIKKKVTSFLLSEEGKISKQSMLAMGSFLTSVAVGSILASKDAAADHNHSLSASWDGPRMVGTHHHGVTDCVVACSSCDGGESCSACDCACSLDCPGGGYACAPYDCFNPDCSCACSCSDCACECDCIGY